MKIQLSNIEKSYGSVRANDDVSLTVESGTIHGLLGENGAGKTTLMKVLSGYLQPDAGEIRIDDRLVRFDSPSAAIAEGIGMLHQDPLDLPPMTVLDNFVLGLEKGLFQRRRQARQRLLTLCRRFGLSLQPDEQVSRLTIGQRQQLELVRLLALGVQVIILDEPTTGISAPQKEILFDTLHRLAEEGLTVIFVSHKLQEVDALCSRATVLRNGQVTGSLDAPFDRERLVQMMFGRSVPAPSVASGATEKVLLDVVSLVIRTYRLELEPITMQLHAGEIIGLAGLEGSGQGLFMQTCAGLSRAHSGHLYLGERDMIHASYRDYIEAGVAFVPAARMEEGMIPGLTIREHFALLDRGNGMFVDWQAAEERARGRIEEYSVVGSPDTRVEELSGGNQQRALLALLPPRVQVLILEHPTRGLDLGSERWIWQELHHRCAQGTAIFFTSTDLDELLDNSDRIVVFSGGQVSDPVPSGELSREALGYMIGGVNL